MAKQNLINYKQLSLLLAGKNTTISRTACPKVYEDDVQELENLVEMYCFKKKSEGKTFNKDK